MAQNWVNVVIHLIHQSLQVNVLAQACVDFLNLLKAVVAAVNVLACDLRNIVQIRAVTRHQSDVLAALFQHVQSLKVLRQVTIRLRQQDRVTASDGIAGEDTLELGILSHTRPNKERGRISGVAWGVDNLQLRGDAVNGDNFAVDKRFCPIAVVRVKSSNWRAGKLAQTLRSRRMVVMTVSNKNQRHFTRLRGDDVEVTFVLRTWVNDDCL